MELSPQDKLTLIAALVADNAEPSPEPETSLCETRRPKRNTVHAFSGELVSLFSLYPGSMFRYRNPVSRENVYMVTSQGMVQLATGELYPIKKDSTVYRCLDEVVVCECKQKVVVYPRKYRETLR